MSSFAQKLKYYVEKSGQTIYSVSVTSGVERTMVHKMIKGDRIPTNKDIVLAIARTLLLSPSDTDDLLTAYEISLRGESAYHQLQYVQKLLLNCAKPSLLKIDSTPPKISSKNIQSILSQQDITPQIITERPHINQLVRTLLEMELQKPNGHVYLIAQPDYQYLYELLASLTCFAPGAKVDNIICFDQANDDDDCYNLRCLEKLMPTLLSCPAFEAHCYYDHVDSLFNEWSLLPCMLLTSEYSLCFSADAGQALFFDSPEINKFMKQFFHKKMICTSPICHSLTTSFSNYLEKVIMSGKAADLAPQIYTILYQPCLTPFIDDDIIASHLKMEYFSEDMLRRIATHFAVVKRTIINSCFTQEGLELFLNTGRITEIPDMFYKPLDVESRRRVLKNMLRAVDTGFLVPRIINTAKLNLPVALNVEALSPTRIILYLRLENDTTFSLTLNEPSLLHAFYGFMEYIQNSRLVYSQAETLNILQELEKNYL